MVPQYRIEVCWSAEDGAWIADVPDLRYCTAHGPTPHDADAEVEFAMEAWLEAAARTAVQCLSRPPARATDWASSRARCWATRVAVVGSKSDKSAGPRRRPSVKGRDQGSVQVARGPVSA